MGRPSLSPTQRVGNFFTAIWLNLPKFAQLPCPTPFGPGKSLRNFGISEFQHFPQRLCQRTSDDPRHPPATGPFRHGQRQRRPPTSVTMPNLSSLPVKFSRPAPLRSLSSVLPCLCGLAGKTFLSANCCLFLPSGTFRGKNRRPRSPQLPSAGKPPATSGGTPGRDGRANP
jgi:hypothetical protein